jgi:rhodanese-related sulfurtransferase
MSKLFKYSVWLVVILVAVNFVSCKKSSTEPEPEPVNEFNVLIQYLEGSDGGYINTDAPAIISADDIRAVLDDYKIVDIRSAADYTTSHITGAVNVTLANVVTYCQTNYTTSDQILVACYTGQSAGHAVLALNVLGYNAYSLKFGMSCADTTLDRWTSNCSSAYEAHFTTTATALGAAGSYPTLSTGKTSGAEILADRVSAMLTAGFKSVSASDVLANPDDYYIVNYFSESDYLGNGNCPLGHIEGAFQYTPKQSLKTSEDLATLPTDKQIVVYCWTGQTSSQVTAFLNILGYEAYSLRFGVNGMVYETLTGSRWSEAQITTLPLTSG